MVVESNIIINSKEEEIKKDELTNLIKKETENQDQQNKLKQNSIQASFSIIKAVVGAGSFALPGGFKYAGFWGGFFGLIILAFLSNYTIKLLVICKNKLNNEEGEYITYYDLVLRVLGKYFAISLYIALVITSLGICSAYFVFCAPLLNEMIPSIPAYAWTLIMGAITLCLCLIRSYKYLSYTSILGDIALMSAVITVIVYGFLNETLVSPMELPGFQWKTYPKFFGAAAFLFCIHFLMLPIEQSMIESSKFTTSLNYSFLFVSILNIVFASMGYLFFKEKTEYLVLFNLKNGSYVYVAKIALVKF
jgi:proton-coupled amino acid transporter